MKTERHERRFASALVEVLNHELRAAAAADVECLVVRLETAWLPKALVQKSSRLRQAPLFNRVEQLHSLVAVTGVELVLVGPSDVPRAVQNAVHRC